MNRYHNIIYIQLMTKIVTYVKNLSKTYHFNHSVRDTPSGVPDKTYPRKIIFAKEKRKNVMVIDLFICTFEHY